MTVEVTRNDVLGPFQKAVGKRAERDYTRRARNQLRMDPQYEEKGIIFKERFFQNRFCIIQDTPINGGVIVGSRKESLLIDEKEDPKLVASFMDFMRYKRESGCTTSGEILNAIWMFVREKIPYNAASVLEKEKGIQKRQIMKLSEFFGGGVCLHQSALAGYLTEKMIIAGKLRGFVSIDRSRIDSLGGHSFVRYETWAGHPIIIDASNDDVSPRLLSQVEDPDFHAFYERPSDRSPVLRKLLPLYRKLLRATLLSSRH